MTKPSTELLTLARRIEDATGCDPLDVQFVDVFALSWRQSCERCRRVTATAMLIDGEEGEDVARLCGRCTRWV